MQRKTTVRPANPSEAQSPRPARTTAQQPLVQTKRNPFRLNTRRCVSMCRAGRGGKKSRIESDKLTSVNCRGQTPTVSPNLASIQCSSRRLMTVRRSPCEAQLRAQRGQKAASVRKGEPQNKVDQRRNAGRAVLTEERALSSQSSILQHLTSTLFMTEGPVLSAAI